MRNFSILWALPLLILHVIDGGRPASAQSAWPNEPVGSPVLLDCGFDTPLCGGRLLDPYNGAGLAAWPPSLHSISVVDDPTAPFSPSKVYRSTRFANQPSGGSQSEFYLPRGTKEIYTSVWWRTSAQFEGKNHGGNKLFFIRGQGPGTNGVFLFSFPRGSSNGRIIWSTQLPYNLDQCGGADIDICWGNVAHVPIVPGSWYRIEVYMKASSCATCHDGIVRWWITPKGGTPQLAGNYVNFAYGPAVDTWLWSETWDGSGPVNEWVTEAYHEIDHLRISAPNCGASCSGAPPPPPPPSPTPVPPPPPPTVAAPGTVTNLALSQIGSSSMTLSFTQVDDGTGLPAKYDVRLSSSGGLWGGGLSVSQGTCSTPLQGTGTSGTLSCVVAGLSPSTRYDFQLVSFRGTMNQGAVYGALSNVASGATSSGQTFAPTDVNKDGVTNITDVQLGINQALGLSACSTGDANGDGVCTILDIQRIVNGALGL